MFRRANTEQVDKGKGRAEGAARRIEVDQLLKRPIDVGDEGRKGDSVQRRKDVGTKHEKQEASERKRAPGIQRRKYRQVSEDAIKGGQTSRRVTEKSRCGRKAVEGKG